MKIIDQIKRIIASLNPAEFVLSRQTMGELLEDHRDIESQLEAEKIKNRLLGNVIQKYRLHAVNEAMQGYGTNDFSSDPAEREANREKLRQRIKAALDKNGGKFSFEGLSAKPQPIAKNEAVPAGATHYAICGSTGRKSYYKNVDGLWFWKTSFEWERSVAGKEWLDNRLIAIVGSERV